MNEQLYAWLGRAFARNIMRQLRGNESIYQTARNLRKNGFGLQTALILLTRVKG